MKVRFTSTGRTQFLAALAYIRRDDPTTASRFRQRVETRLRRLEQFPLSGRVIPEFPDMPHREIIISPYHFFYRVKKETVWVIAVWYSAQLPNEPIS